MSQVKFDCFKRFKQYLYHDCQFMGSSRLLNTSQFSKDSHTVDVLPEGELLFRQIMRVPISVKEVLTLGLTTWPAVLLPATAAGVPLGRGGNPPICLFLTGTEHNTTILAVYIILSSHTHTP